jgi:hypothetical protein
MGRVFLEHLGGQRIFSCAHCDAPLTNRNELVSTRFTGATGRAFLFSRVVNTKQSPVQERVNYLFRFFYVEKQIFLDDVNWSSFCSRYKL